MADLLAVLGLPALWLLELTRMLLDKVSWFGNPPSWIAVVIASAVLLRIITLPLWIRSMAGERNDVACAPVRASLLAHRLPPEETAKVRGALRRSHPTYNSAQAWFKASVGLVSGCMIVLWWSVFWGADPGDIGLKALADDTSMASVFYQVFTISDPWVLLATMVGGAVLWALVSYSYNRTVRSWLMPTWSLTWGRRGGYKLRVAKYLVGGLLFVPFGALLFVVTWTALGAIFAYAFLRPVNQPDEVWDRFVEPDPYDGSPRIRAIVPTHAGMPLPPGGWGTTPPPTPPGGWGTNPPPMAPPPPLPVPVPALPGVHGGPPPRMAPVLSAAPRGNPLLPGDPRMVGGYKLLGRIGAGGMGTVYFAQRPGTSTTVALKTTNGMVLDSDLERERFQRECDTLALADGPYTARVLDSGIDRGRPYLVTELLDGLTLHDYVHIKGPVTDPTALRSLGVAFAEGLRTLHDLGVVHRDIKPANIMLTTGGPKIIDFGIALNPDSTRLTKTGVQLGTFAFMAPEQFEDSRVTAATDVWAWACCLVMAATVKAPFDADSIPKITHKVITAPPNSELLQKVYAIDAKLGAVVTDALRKPVDERPADGSALVDRLCPEGDEIVQIGRGWPLIAGKIGG
ncbi:serine/threonine-protein kinase [Phytomonospora sp. NPDC050363]|uniref:serine/threonine-protein kinase n=1 Tax=Phytomonospora sp. NPDC050363 TaxID=3155642 RepID=UPI0033F180B8